MNLQDAIESLYCARWGQPTRRAVFRTTSREISVLKWSADSNEEEVDLYATIGASIDPIYTDRPDHRVEFIVGLIPAADEIASPLAALALHACQTKEIVTHGHIVRNDGPLWPATAMDSFLLLEQTSILTALSLPDVHVDFLQAVPIYGSEQEYVFHHGVDSLLARWEVFQTPFWNSTR